VDGQVFVVRGDLSQLAAHAVGYSTDTFLNSGHLSSAFAAHFPGFREWRRKTAREHPRGSPVGQAFWFPAGFERRPLGVVVAVSTGGDRTEEDKAALAVRAAIHTAVDRLRNECGKTGRLLIALPAFRTGMGGDRHALLRSARAQIGEARQALQRLPGVDVAFVPYSAAVYRLFLEARAEQEPDHGPTLPWERELEQALGEGPCVVFVGAGLSHGAGLPNWRELLGHLAGELGLDPEGRHDDLDLAQWYREKFGDQALAKVIADRFSRPAHAARPTLAHYLLLNLPTRLVLTTNYDDLLEQALLGLKRYPVRIARDVDVARTALGEGTCVVKLHGDADSPLEVVLCRDDYEAFFERRPAMTHLLRGLLLNHTFLFVGYSLRDPNFRSIFAEVGRILRDGRRPAFATTFDAAGPAGAYIQGQWNTKYLRLIPVSSGEPETALARFLDRLGARLALRQPEPMLAAGAEVSTELAGVRHIAAGELAREVERLCRAQLELPTDRRMAAELLTMLTRLGWHPRGNASRSLAGYWRTWPGRPKTPPSAGAGSSPHSRRPKTSSRSSRSASGSKPRTGVTPQGSSPARRSDRTGLESTPRARSPAARRSGARGSRRASRRPRH
jgi:hypothetical protein